MPFLCLLIRVSLCAQMADVQVKKRQRSVNMKTPKKTKKAKAHATKTPILWCSCKTPYTGRRPMVGCDSCNEWYHLTCVSLKKCDAVAMPTYDCPRCVHARIEGRPICVQDKPADPATPRTWEEVLVLLVATYDDKLKAAATRAIADASATESEEEEETKKPAAYEQEALGLVVQAAVPRTSATPVAYHELSPEQKDHLASAFTARQEKARTKHVA
jgi:hypothetical protein